MTLLLAAALLLLIASIDSIECLPGRGFRSTSAPGFQGTLGDSELWKTIAVAMHIVATIAIALLVLQVIIDGAHRRAYLCILAVCCAALLVTDHLGFDELCRRLRGVRA